MRVLPLLLLFVVLPLGGNEEGKLLPASMVQLPAESMTLRGVLTEIDKTGNQTDYRNRQGSGSADLLLKGLPTKPTPYWTLIDHVARDANLRTVLQPAEGDQPARLLLTSIAGDARPALRPSCVKGPFKLIIAEAARLADDQAKLALRFNLRWEPKLNPIWMRPGPLQIRAVDGPWKRTEDASTAVIRLRGLSAGVWSTQLPIPPDASALELEGELRLLVSTGRLRLSPATLFPGAKVAKEGVELDIQSIDVRADLREWVVQLLLRYPKATFDLESHQGWALGDLPGELAEAGPNPARYRTANPAQVSIDESRGIRLTYLFKDVPAQGPSVLTISVPAPPVEQDLPLKFEKIPLR